ncbi:hypothetical protein [Mycobacterium sp. E2238]|uniref:DUF6941 family protein n=1 Tax=Mycobacterium sp. E2238 TaxID=1834131 RepID=UPI0007FF2357|nr:hypothetical protein [Mycobacterium sp. E2238]OBI23831.1 hypothetical protein A5711_10035 [Mycobacterium sp. E2238]
MAAELDYAFIAEYAKVEGGKLTAVGASYIDIRPPTLPAQHILYLAGRVRAPEDTETIILKLRIDPPGNVNIVIDGTITIGPEDPRYAGKVAAMFAASAAVPLLSAGLCEISVEVDGVPQRRLAYEIIAPQ